MKGQISAEMLILMAVILAVVAIAALQILGSAKETGKNIDTQTQTMNQKLGNAVKAQVGERCVDTTDCADGLTCDNTNHCVQ